MKELLTALEKFSVNPDAIGDNLFGFFASIMSMTWEDVVAAGFAIDALKSEAWTRALETEKLDKSKKALDDPTFRRLNMCLAPVVSRVAQLIALAPQEQKLMLIESVSGKYGFVFVLTATDWKKTL